MKGKCSRIEKMAEGRMGGSLNGMKGRPAGSNICFPKLFLSFSLAYCPFHRGERQFLSLLEHQSRLAFGPLGWSFFGAGQWRKGRGSEWNGVRGKRQQTALHLHFPFATLKKRKECSQPTSHSASRWLFPLCPFRQFIDICIWKGLFCLGPLHFASSNFRRPPFKGRAKAHQKWGVKGQLRGAVCHPQSLNAGHGKKLLLPKGWP